MTVLGPAQSGAWKILEGMDTTRYSLAHRLFAATPEHPQPGLAYASTVCATYVLLFIAGILSLPAMGSRYGSVRLPFLLDWNVLFMFTVAMPSLVAFTVGDDRVLVRSISLITRDDIVALSDADAEYLKNRWQAIYARTNLVAQWLGLGIGLTLAWANYQVYSPAVVGYWIAVDGRLTLAGIAFLYCITLYYAVLPVYILRSVVTAMFLRDFVGRSVVRLVPFHPDHCGGLRPVGSLGLRNQYLLSIYGFNLASLIFVSGHFLAVPSGLRILIVIATIAYLVFGPLVFLAPLVPFRSGMLRNKAELMNDVAKRLRTELTRIRAQLLAGSITKEDERLIARLRNIGSLIEELPVWPFDARTLRRFLTAYVLPLVGSIGVPLLKSLGTVLLAYLAAT